VTELKQTYSAREVAAMTGLSARQLQWWDTRRIFAPHLAPRRTERGGYTERRYTPVDLIELLVLADLRRQGLTAGKLRQLLDTLRERFGIRLYETIGPGGPLTLLTDGHDVYGRTPHGALFNLLRDPVQPLLVIESGAELRELTARSKRKSKGTKRAKAGAARESKRATIR
jgi:DNA-binding transcriptional MerR regulator